MKVTAWWLVNGVAISITNVWIFVHRISLLRRRSKAAHLYVAVFHFVLGICKVTVKNQTIFTKEQRMCSITWCKKKSGGESEADQAKKLLPTYERKHLPVLFTNAFTIIKSGRPFTDFEFLIKLDKAKGVEVSNTYLNRKQGSSLA